MLQACLVYNKEGLDFHLFFCSRKARQLQASLSDADIQAGMDHPSNCHSVCVDGCCMAQACLQGCFNRSVF